MDIKKILIKILAVIFVIIATPTIDVFVIHCNMWQEAALMWGKYLSYSMLSLIVFFSSVVSWFIVKKLNSNDNYELNHNGCR